MDGFAKELIVRFYLFVWNFHKDFTMFVSETHQGLDPSGYLGYGQSAVIQRPAYFQQDYDVIMSLSIFMENPENTV